MKKFVPMEKRSKKAQKEHYRSRRRDWGELSPVTRVVPDGKKYDRNKEKQNKRKSDIEFRGEYGIAFFNDLSPYVLS